MNLTPLEIENVNFRRMTFGGYDRNEVERFLAQAARSIEAYLERIDKLERQLLVLESDLLHYKENEDLLRNSVVLAQRTADELIAAARQRASSIEGEAILEAKRLNQSLATLKDEREQFEFAFHSMLHGFMRRLEQANPALAASSAPLLPIDATAKPAAATRPPDDPQSAVSAASPVEPPSPEAEPQNASIHDSETGLTRANLNDSDAEQFAQALR